ncbi:MAG: ATP-binding protein [Planctomycetales bacterium]
MSNNTFTILVVDDNPGTLYATSHVLQRAGWTVLEAKTGQEGLEMANPDIDLVVLDIHLPDMDGYEVCRRIRELPKLSRLPVVHLSATFIKSDDKLKSFEVGADGFLTHPVEPPVLVATVGAFLRARKAEREREQLLESERAARMESERANRFKDEFLATLSHELRTPLQAIIGWSQLLKVGNHSKAQYLEGLDAIEENARAQSQMIGDLLDVTRIDSGKLHMDVQEVNIPELIESVLGATVPSAEEKKIRLVKTIQPFVGSVVGDMYRLRQVVWNLVQNAIKFTPEGGQIQIGVLGENSHIEISVSDNGQGIALDLLPQIFERFRQGDGSSTRSQGGLGLGLSIARQLVELHGGSIRAESAGAGKGAKFIVTLPVATPSRLELMKKELAPHSAEEGSSGNPRSLKEVRILVVDDDTDTRRLLVRSLDHSGAITKECARCQRGSWNPFRNSSPMFCSAIWECRGRMGLS